MELMRYIKEEIVSKKCHFEST